MNRSAPPPERADRRPRLVIGLLNNMADAALATTERQFSALLAEAAAEFEVELRLFSLTEIERSERARAEMSGRYAGGEALAHAGLDALIVTGAEPRAANLEDEPYWASLTKVIDWTETAGLPTVWSCLAAHAAVLHQAGVRRRGLAAKLSGVYACARTGDDRMTAALPETPSIPHSRWNDLEETALAAAGYEILTRSAVAGVDAFRRGGEGLSLYFQGHPEYDADSLMREYGRDVGRFLRGERPAHPSVPVGYLSPESERALQQLAERARGRPDPGQLPAYYAILNAACPKQVWRAAAVALYRAWLGQVAGPSGMPSRGSRSRLLVPPPRVV